MLRSRRFVFEGDDFRECAPASVFISALRCARVGACFVLIRCSILPRRAGMFDSSSSSFASGAVPSAGQQAVRCRHELVHAGIYNVQAILTHHARELFRPIFIFIPTIFVEWAESGNAINLGRHAKHFETIRLNGFGICINVAAVLSEKAGVTFFEGAETPFPCTRLACSQLACVQFVAELCKVCLGGRARGLAVLAAASRFDVALSAAMQATFGRRVWALM